MQPKKSRLERLERTMVSAFGVQPDWYEDYWLRPKEASRPIGGRWCRSNLLLRTMLCVAIVSMCVYFGR